ncbi:3-isopropylmalate dehydrogenase [Sphingomonas sp. 28-63-12]|uniref:3-isopropylmalate dehydrogenase n=1 Tax=Sphingomonas sp. 28-63-12 TaxID=1970434 RepID=UPI000BD7724D|nr:MAG: 3-isopropylmalate dehydrogenase [Sphingomonas sp. 28-63-12]
METPNASKTLEIAVLPGDGIGPEVTREALSCLALLSDRDGLGLRFTAHDFGGVAIDRHGDPLPDATLAAARAADAILMGAIGGPKWAGLAVTPETGLLRLRKELGLFANLRPARMIPGMENLSPLRTELVTGIDILVVRELTGGLYFGEHILADDHASDVCAYSRAEIERIAHVAFRAAQGRAGRVTSVDKANVLASSKLWRRVVTEVALGYPDVTLDHLYVDAAAMELIKNPRRFDVILTENLFGDILSDELSVIPGSIGLLGSASTGAGQGGLYEPIHGSAPDIAGQDRANPAGMMESAAMMLDMLGASPAAQSLRDAVRATLLDGVRTADLGGSVRCSDFGDAVRTRLATAMATMSV